jgi:DNA polymerase III alpha subunit|tara:strand:- start:9689 stop:11332 length:1644 start_codon:yes stop_codon:yes gene_type:complete
MVGVKKYSCGCEFQETENGVIFDYDIESLTLSCSATWDMIKEGNTKGVFQLESQLGRSLAKQAKPDNIEELSDLIAIMRPGCLEAIVKGKTLTMHYVDRKHKRDSIEYLHESLEPILNNTYGILVYQEQAMKIATEIAGFDLQEADTLRKAIGKKKADVMAKVKKSFLEKSAIKGIVDEDQAKEIFSWIEKSQRYSFNKSHAISYAYNAYLTAYCKAHFPREFFTSYLRHSIGKPDTFAEVQELVNNAKVMGIQVMPPSVINMNEEFGLLGESPTYGITNVKGVGSSVFNKMQSDMKEDCINPEDCDWDCFLILVSPRVNKRAFENLILAGAFDIFKISRSKMQHQFNIIKELSKREINWLREYKRGQPEDTVQECLRAMIVASDCKDKNRPIFRKDRNPIVEDLLDSYDNPGYELFDSPSWMARQEQELLGIALTCNKVDEYDTTRSNCSCKEFVDGFESQYGICLAVQVDKVREWKIKKGRSSGENMCFLTVSDSSCAIDNVTAFSEEWSKYKKLIYEGSTVLLRGYRDKGRGGFLIKKVEQLRS